MIIETAKQKGCDLIVMASHGRRGLSAIVLGSETIKVVPTAASRFLSIVRRARPLPPYYAHRNRLGTADPPLKRWRMALIEILRLHYQTR